MCVSVMFLFFFARTQFFNLCKTILDQLPCEKGEINSIYFLESKLYYHLTFDFDVEFFSLLGDHPL